jgi:hypothetical protein
LRLKTAADRGGLLQNVTYQNICMQNHRTLISITPHYNSNTGTLLPQFSNITFQNVHGLTNGLMSIVGYDANHLTTLNLNNFVFDTLTQADLSPAFAYDTITLGPGPVFPAFLQSLTGTGVSYNGSITSPTTAPYPCSASTFTFLVGELYLSTATSTNLSTITVPGPGSVTLNAMLQPAMSQVTYTNSTGTAALTAPVQFYEGSNQVGTATLGGNGTIASLTLTGVAAGTHTYTAQYPGDSNYAAYPFGSVNVTVSPYSSATTTVLAVSPSSVQAGSTATLTATVTGAQANAVPTGAINFLDGTTVIASGAVTAASSGATASGTSSVTLNGPGTHSLTVQYMGDLNNATSTSAPVAVTVTAIPTTTTLSLASSSIAAGASEVLSATVTSAAGVPGGTVTFSSGTASLGTANLANGTASLPVVFSAIGSQAITAAYNASGNFGSSNSAALTLAVVTPFTLGLSSATVTIAPGASGSTTVSATPAIGFSGTVTFSCTSPVAYVTCSLSPSSQTVSGTTAVQSTLTVNVASTVSQAAPMNETERIAYGLLLPVGFFSLLGLGRVRRRFRGGMLVWVVCLSVGAIGIVGCGGSGPSKPPAPSGSQVVTVTVQSGAVMQTAQVTVNIGG